MRVTGKFLNLPEGFQWKLFSISLTAAFSVIALSVSLAWPGLFTPSKRTGLTSDTVTISGNAKGLFLSLDARTASHIISPTVRIDASGNDRPKVGCGFLISREGLVVSSWRVIANTQNIIVSLASGEAFQGQVITSDREKDLALIKLQTERTDFPALSLAASSDIYAGMAVMKVGFSPDGAYEPGITAGVVTATPEIGGRGYIQTDAPNKAGTGEPLVNCQGIVVGVCLGSGSDTPSVGLAISAADCLAFLHGSNIGY